MHEDKLKRIDFKFQPISVECASFVILLPPNSKQGNEAVSHFKSSLKKMEELHQSYENLIANHTQKQYTFCINSNNPKLLFCAAKLEKLNSKYQKSYKEFYEWAKDLANQIITFLRDCLSNEACSVVCKYDEFKKSIKTEFNNNKVLTKYKKHILMLDNYAKALEKTNKTQEVSLSELKTQLSYAAESVNPSLNFAPSSNFENLFLEYLESTKMILNFEKLAKKIIANNNNIITPKNADPLRNRMPKATKFTPSSLLSNSYSTQDEFQRALITEKQKDLSIFQSSSKKIKVEKNKLSLDLYDVGTLIKIFFRKFSVKKSTEQSVICCAVIRILFDKLYLIKPSFLYSEDDSYLFFEKCEILKCLTPSDLGIGKSLIKEELLNVPCSIIYGNSNTIQESFSNLKTIMFLANPIDMIYQAFRCLKQIEVFSSENCLEQKYGQFASMFTDKFFQYEMSFDDVFSIFISIVSNSPPANYKDVCNFINSVQNLKFSSPLEYAKTLLTSAYDYISEININDIVNNSHDDHDPLNLKKFSSNEIY